MLASLFLLWEELREPEHLLWARHRLRHRDVHGGTQHWSRPLMQFSTSRPGGIWSHTWASKCLVQSLNLAASSHCPGQESVILILWAQPGPHLSAGICGSPKSGSPKPNLGAQPRTSNLGGRHCCESFNFTLKERAPPPLSLIPPPSPLPWASFQSQQRPQRGLDLCPPGRSAGVTHPVCRVP